MARNRKHGAGTRFVPAIKAALLCLLLGGSAIGFVYQKNQIMDLGKQIQQRQKQLAQLQADNVKLEKTRLMLQAAPALEERLRKLNLGLVPPLQSQILTIVEVPATTIPRSESLYAGEPAGRDSLR